MTERWKQEQEQTATAEDQGRHRLHAGSEVDRWRAHRRAMLIEAFEWADRIAQESESLEEVRDRLKQRLEVIRDGPTKAAS